MNYKSSKTIGVIGWGSLIWKPGKLPVDDKWQSDGPILPIEFARKSNDGRITLVICPNAKPITVLWAYLRTASLEEAIASLGDREKISVENRNASIGVWPSVREPKQAYSELIGNWAHEKDLKHCVWTALGPRDTQGRRGVVPSAQEVVQYLKSLPKERQAHAEKYVRCAPRQVTTEYRRLIEVEFGWLPRDCD